MFYGEYTHTIDAKGRLIIPSEFRDQLGDKFMITKGMDRCLFVYALEDWQVLEQKLKALPLTNPAARQLTRYLLGGAKGCELDKQGRINIPQKLREFAGLDKDALLVGVGDRIEIWNEDLYTETNSYEDIDDLAMTLEGFGI